MTGWIKLHRQLQDNPLWLSEPFTRAQAWVDLLMLANTSNGEVSVRGVRVELRRGDVGWSSVALAKRWKWSRGKVLRFVNELESDQQIQQIKHPALKVIHICNYENYQNRDNKPSEKGGGTTESGSGGTTEYSPDSTAENGLGGTTELPPDSTAENGLGGTTELNANNASKPASNQESVNNDSFKNGRDGTTEFMSDGTAKFTSDSTTEFMPDGTAELPPDGTAEIRSDGTRSKKYIYKTQDARARQNVDKSVDNFDREFARYRDKVTDYFSRFGYQPDQLSGDHQISILQDWQRRGVRSAQLEPIMLRVKRYTLPKDPIAYVEKGLSKLEPNPPKLSKFEQEKLAADERARRELQRGREEAAKRRERDARIASDPKVREAAKKAVHEMSEALG